MTQIDSSCLSIIIHGSFQKWNLWNKVKEKRKNNTFSRGDKNELNSERSHFNWLKWKGEKKKQIRNCVKKKMFSKNKYENKTKITTVKEVGVTKYQILGEHEKVNQK